MPDQTPVTDDDRSRNARKWAEDSRGVGDPGSYLDCAVRFILDTVPAPPVTLADELRAWFNLHHMEHMDSFSALVKRAEAIGKENRDMERELHRAYRERDEARAEVRRLTEANDVLERDRKVYEDDCAKKHDRITELTQQVESLTVISDEAVSLGYWLADKLGEHVDDQDDETLVETVQRLVERLTDELDKAKYGDWLKEDLPDPADVPKGELWLIRAHGWGGLRVGVRNDAEDRPGYPWRWIDMDQGGAGGVCSDNHVTLVARLAPDPRRVIDTVDGLNKLPVGSVVLDGDGDAWQKIEGGSWNIGIKERSAFYLIDNHGPVTVIHEPMSDHRERSGSDS